MRQIDLNLLVVLHALLTERSVTKAARRLALGQPATSHALGRLREVFDDPLLVRQGRSMIPTPRAEALELPLERWLAEARRLLEQEPRFDPETSRRRFNLRSPDLLAPLLPRIVGRMSALAPHADLEIAASSSQAARALETGATDVVLGTVLDDELEREPLGRARFAVVLRATHPAVRRTKKLSARAWTAHPHIVVRSGSSSRSVVGEALAEKKLERHVGLVLPSFLEALVTVSQTDFFFTAPRQLVLPLLEPLSLKMLAPPVDIPSVEVCAFWHPRMQADPGHAFFRGLIVDEVRRAFQAC